MGVRGRASREQAGECADESAIAERVPDQGVVSNMPEFRQVLRARRAADGAGAGVGRVW